MNRTRSRDRDAQGTGLHLHLEWQRAERLAVEVHRGWIAVDPQATESVKRDRRVSDVGAAVQAWQLAKGLEARQVADEAHRFRVAGRPPSRNEFA